jgi:hypothetical protein
MEGNFQLDNPDEMQATMTLTMNVAQWKRIAEVLKGADYTGPTSELKTLIRKLIDRAYAGFHEESPFE